MPIFEGRAPWRISFSDGMVWTETNSGPLKGEIIVEHNSVGAVTGGQLTVEGYLNWPQFSRSVKIELLKNNAWEPICVGAIGKLSSTSSVTGKRSTTLPIVGYGQLDADGLARVGWRNFDFGGGAPTLLGSLTLPELEFGMTNGGRLAKALENDVLASWGVRPDGVNVAGNPANWSGPVQNLPLETAGLFIQPSNDESTHPITEYEARAAERWQAELHQRTMPALYPRQATNITTDTLLSDEKQNLLNGLTPVYPLLSLDTDGLFQGGFGAGYIAGVVDLKNIVKNSQANTEKKDATYLAQAITIDVLIRVNDLPVLPPANFFPTTDLTRNLLLARHFIAENPKWKEQFPLGSAQNTQKTADWDSYRTSTSAIALANAEHLRTRQQAWDRIHSAAYFNLHWGEWLTTSNEALPAIVNSPRDTEIASIPKSSYPASAEYGGLMGITDSGSFEVPYYIEETYLLENKYLRSDFEYQLKPQATQGFIKLLAQPSVSTLDMKSRTVFAWRFSVPEALLKQVDISLPENYKWAFAVAVTANINNIIITNTAMNSITVNIETPVGTYYYKGQNGTVEEGKNVAGYLAPLESPETQQGRVNGVIGYGPMKIAGQWVSNSKIIIGAGSYSMEFQTGARQ